MPGPPAPAAAPARVKEGLHQLLQKRVRPHVGGEVVGRAPRRVGDACGQQPVCDGLGVHIGETGLVQVVHQRGLECLHELRERAGLGLDGKRRPDAVADRAGQLGQALGELLRGGDNLAVAQCEGRAPALAPGVGVVLVVGPSEVIAKFADDGVEVERRIEVVPAEHLEGGQVAAVRGLREVREGNAALLALTVVGHEEQVVGGPGLALGTVRRGALLERHLAQDATQRHHGQTLWLELDEEDAPGLARRERAQALDLLNLGCVFRVDAELLGGVFEGQLFKVVRVDRPIQFVTQVSDELVEATDVCEAFAVVGRHRFRPRSVPSSSAAAVWRRPGHPRASGSCS